ncbi:MAG: hypothetical protein R2867_40515, partial [Caldilineaceae bacterium]
WALENATCSDGSPPTKIDVAPGETVTCTFTNAKRGQLVVRKVTVPDPDRSDSTFAFTTDNTLTPTNFGIKSGKTFQFDNLEPRNGYIIRELAAANWQLTGSNCSNGSSTTNIRIDPGETTTCTFTNIGTLVDLQLSKEDGGITAEPGDTIVYTLRYRNDGTKTAQNVKITEQVPAHTTFVGDASWNCAMNAPAGTICQNTITALAGGTSGSIQFKVKVNSTLPANVTAISNTAKLGYSEVAEVTQRTINTPLQSTIGLLLSKDDAGATAVPGGTVLYTLDYVNNGNQTVTGVTITETVPAHTTFVTSNVPWSCAPGAPAGTMCTHHLTNSLGVGQSGQLTFQVRVQDKLPAEVFLIENRAVIGSSGAPNTDVGTEQTELRAAPDLTLAISDHGATVTPGAVIRYTLSYANVGTQGATGVVITENVPAHTTFFAAEGNNAWNCSAASCTYSVGNLASGASGTVDFVLKVNRPLPVGVTAIENSATIADDGNNGVDSASGNNQDSISTAIVDTTPMVISKRDTLVIDLNQDQIASPGDTLEYVVTIENRRGLPVRNVIFTDTLEGSLQLVPGIKVSQGTVLSGNSTNDRVVQANIGILAGDSSATIRFRVGIRTPLPANVVTVSNQGTGQSSDFNTRRTDDPDTATTNDATQTLVNAKAAVEISLADFLFVDANGDALVSIGDTLIYRLVVRNRGNGGSPSLQVRDAAGGQCNSGAKHVVTSGGIIREGTDSEDRVVRVDVGEVSGGAAVNISELQIIPMNGFTSVQHQAFAVAPAVSGQTDIPSDDPDTGAASDATVTLLNKEIVTTSLLYLPVVVNQ